MDASVYCKKCEMKTRHVRDEKKKLNSCCLCGGKVKFKKGDFLVESTKVWKDGRPAGMTATAEAGMVDKPAPGKTERRGKYSPAMKAEIYRRLGEKEKATALAKEFGCKPWTIYSLARAGREFAKGMSAPAVRDPALAVARAIGEIEGTGRGMPLYMKKMQGEDKNEANRGRLSDAVMVIINMLSERITLAIAEGIKQGWGK